MEGLLEPSTQHLPRTRVRAKDKRHLPEDYCHSNRQFIRDDTFDECDSALATTCAANSGSPPLKAAKK